MRSRDSITDAWVLAAQTSLDLSTHETMSAPQLLDHLPSLYDDLTDFVRGGEPTGLAKQHSQLHGRDRWEQHYRLDELLRELLLLRRVVVREIDRFQATHQPPLSHHAEHLVRERVTQFFDEATIASVSQFSSDHQAKANENQRLLTARHEAAQTAADNLQAVDAARLRLLRVIAHELRNFLNSASLNTDALREESDPQACDEIHAVLDRSHRQMTALINELLDAAPLLSGHEALRLARLDLLHFIQQERRDLERMAAAKRLELRCHVVPELGEVVSDESKLRRIVTNLVQNAIKYTDAGSVAIEIAPVEPARWQLQVSDTGCGIPPEHQDKIFEEFHRLPGVAEREGTGLGLSIVKHLVQMLNGEIHVKSQPGKGTSFNVLFPSEVA